MLVLLLEASEFRAGHMAFERRFNNRLNSHYFLPPGIHGNSRVFCVCKRKCGRLIAIITVCFLSAGYKSFEIYKLVGTLREVGTAISEASRKSG